MKGFTLTPGQVDELKKVHRKVPHRREADRIKAIVLLGTGWTLEQTAEALLLDTGALRRYVQTYQADGLDALLLMAYQGSQPKLTNAQLRKLEKQLSQTIYLCAKDVARYVKETFGVLYTTNGVTNLLHRMGYTYKKPKAVPGKADALAQEQFVRKYKTLKKCKKPHDPIYFMDGVHPQHNSVPAFGWIKKGETKTIKSNTGRTRLNLNGVINAETHQVVIRHDETINAQSTVALFTMLEKKHRKAEKIYVIADNARYYRSKVVKAFLRNSRIKLIFLPPYSPNLNLIERLWKYFRKVVLYNRYYETFAEFKERAIAFFATIRKHKTALRTLLTDNFEIIAA